MVEKGKMNMNVTNWLDVFGYVMGATLVGMVLFFVLSLGLKKKEKLMLDLCIITIIGFVIGAVGYFFTSQKVDVLRNDFVLNELLVDEESPEIEYMTTGNTDKLEYLYVVKTTDKLFMLEVASNMNQDKSFDYNIKDTYQRGGK